MQNIEKIAVSPRMQHDNDNPHMKGTPQLSLQSFSLFQQMMINTQLQWQALQSSSYYLGRGSCAWIYTKTRRSSPGGRKSQGDKPNILMESPSMPDLCLTEPDLSLTKCNYQSES